MQQKLNSKKTYKDNGLLVVGGMIIAYVMMLLPLCWDNGQTEEKPEQKGVVACYGCKHYDEDTDSCVEGDEWSKRCEAGFPTDTLDERVELNNSAIDRAIHYGESWYPGELNSSGDAQEMPVLTSSESHQRFIELCEKYNLPADVIWYTENYYGLKEGTVACISIAETSGGKKGYGVEGCWNYGNVGNTDNPNNRRCFANQGAGLAAIGQTLKNDYLKNNQTIACLNGAGNCIEPNASNKRYSTGKSGNRQRNLIACFYSIYQTPINPQTFNLHDR